MLHIIENFLRLGHRLVLQVTNRYCAMGTNHHRSCPTAFTGAIRLQSSMNADR